LIHVRYKEKSIHIDEFALKVENKEYIIKAND